MSDTFTCYPIENMVQWILAEEKTGTIFGIPRELFFVPGRSDPFKISRYGKTLETPIGVAAGPHTQLSQNIISAWLTGARYMELKTVQVLDELSITKPCIKMEDEGYNCEWSQELKLHQSYDEYLNAWIILHLLKDKFGWGEEDQRGFIFNMSVGYNLEGILTKSVQQFLNNLGDCSKEKAKKIKSLSRIYPRIKEINIPNCISDNITISTMHGCPPNEIEKIGRYFIEERKLHTTIKLNPTLLGPERLRDILNSKLGFDVSVPDEAFEHDLKFDDGVVLIKNLIESASEAGVEFGVKLTNTLETLNRRGNLPENEKMVYMSGRPLHAISINVAAKLQACFEGSLNLFFSAGVDCFNVARVLSCNLMPITVCSDILKPGGYTRLGQYLETIKKSIRQSEAENIREYICNLANQQQNTAKSGYINLVKYAAEVVTDERYYKSQFPYENIKTDRELSLFDCTLAPCLSTCPTEQDVPSYIAYTAAGEYEKAHQVILQTNPFPSVQGQVCHQPCRSKCTRINLDTPLKIRELKRFIAEQNKDSRNLNKKPANGLKTAIIGAGPSGLSCAFFLALEGFAVDIFEARSVSGGMAANAIPEFRLDNQSLQSDIDRIISLGVNIHHNSPVDRERFEVIRSEYDALYVAIGAQSSMKMGIPGEDAKGVFDQLDFLRQVKSREIPAMGDQIVVIGGGNSAMDAARTARRLVGSEGTVTILYRRTQKEMPADFEEIEETVREGVKIVELVAPEQIITREGQVIGIECAQMKLGDIDASGRPKPVKIKDSLLRFNADIVIPAIGQKVKLDFFPKNKLAVDPSTHETELKSVFAGGDAVRGASTLIDAIADGRKTAENIIKSFLRGTETIIDKKTTQNRTLAEYYQNLAHRDLKPTPQMSSFSAPLDFNLVSQSLTESEALREAQRCLACDQFCLICTTVCPNRANIAVSVKPFDLPLQTAYKNGGRIKIESSGILRVEQPLQILNIEDFCNECGNCTSFCPTSGAPYKIKPKLCLSEKSFLNTKNGLFINGNQLVVKVGNNPFNITLKDDKLCYDSADATADFDTGSFQCTRFEFKNPDIKHYNLEKAVIFGFLFVNIHELTLFINT
ncbi:putative selenate reductase subunit YgfK [bacterium]|nr:putative selenate reductase subunit YgfK [bacterium]